MQKISLRPHLLDAGVYMGQIPTNLHLQRSGPRWIRFDFHLRNTKQTTNDKQITELASCPFRTNLGPVSSFAPVSQRRINLGAASRQSFSVLVLWNFEMLKNTGKQGFFRASIGEKWHQASTVNTTKVLTIPGSIPNGNALLANPN